MSGRVRVGRLLVALGATLTTVVGAGSAGHAAASVVAGWWTSAPVALAPDAPEDALVVQGGAANALAYGAVRFTLSPGEEPAFLTLRLADGAVSTPDSTLALCPLSESFEPAQGGALADAPDFDCTRPVQAPVGDDGATYRFDVAGMATGDELAVAILPTTSTDRAVLAPPATTDLTAGGGAPLPPPPRPASASASDGTGAGAGGGEPSGLGGGSAGAPSGSGVAAGPFGAPRPAIGTPGIASAAVPAPVAPTAPAPGSNLQATPARPAAAATDDRGGSWQTTLLFLGLAGVASFLWLRRTTPDVDLAPA